jgi:hypothetical protein
VDPYVKLDISRYLSLISKIREMGFLLPKEQELRAANIPFDETEPPLRELFFQFLRLYQEGEPIPQPGHPEGDACTLPELELYCRKLDLYFSFAKAFGCPVDEDRLYDCREDVAEEINEILVSYHGEPLLAKYYEDGYLHRLQGIITRIDALAKFLLFGDKRIEFKNLIDLQRA